MDFYIGKPYSFRSFNCWDYVSLVREDNNIKTKQFQPLNLDNAFDIITAEMQKLGHGLSLVNSPRNFDIIIVKKLGERTIYHCGIYYNGDVMHCSLAAKQVIKQTYNDFKKGYDELTIWR